ncbi:MAG: hypothetical protein CM1200mP2_37850 [Planctomycetaceae bacterium]|nr:MAG: hypothetical protein CM1200mP2_37850 [Planctomycetaceae bacterium]
MFVSPITRRTALGQLGDGFAGMAIGSLIASTAAADSRRSSLDQRSPGHRAPARAVIQLFMHGGPSHVDLLDPKPMLSRYHGTTPPAEVDDDEDRTKYLLGSPFSFRRYGESGLEFSEVMSGVANHADDIAVIRSMFTEHRNHEQAIWMANTGLIRPGRPNIGSGQPTDWDPKPTICRPTSLCRTRSDFPSTGPQLVQWLVPRSTRERALSPHRVSRACTSNHPRPVRRPSARGGSDFSRRSIANICGPAPGELELEARIANFELAARMKLSATDALDLSSETKATHEMYGLNNPTTKSYGRRCLMARRLIERGVRFVQLFMRGQPWDTHSANTKVSEGLRSNRGAQSVPC